MANIIDILINAKWTGGEAIKKAGSEIRELGNRATASSDELFTFGLKLGAGITVATIAYQKFAQTAQKAIEAVKEGAEIELVNRRFDRLAQSIGTTTQNLQSELLATAGTTTLATDIMILGLATTHDEVVALSNASIELGLNINQLSKILEDQTIEEFLEGAAKQLENIEKRSESTAGKIDIVAERWEKLKNSLKEQIAIGVAPFFEGLSEGEEAAANVTRALINLQETGPGFEEQIKATNEFKKALEELSILTGGPFLYRGLDEQIARAAALLAIPGQTIEEQQNILRDYGFIIEDVIGGTTVTIEGYAIAWRDVADAINEVKFDRIISEARDADKILQNYIQLTEDTSESLRRFGDITHIPREDLEILAEFMGITVSEAKELVFQFESLEEAAKFIEEIAKNPTQFFKGFEDLFGGIGPAIGGLQEAATEQIDLWLGFQADLTDISVREGELREQAEADYEKRRTEIVNDFGARRAQEEANWQRQIARQDEQLRRNIEQVQEDSGERQAELREDANRRLANLERDHLDRMREIIESADLQLADAASRLDAKAVAAIERGREESLNNEKQAYTKQREEINRELQERLEAEREAAEERIEEMKEFHEERQKQEEEDRQYRLQQEQLAHDERLREFDQEHQDRLDQIKKQARDAERQRDIQYQSERMQLGDHWRQRDTLERQWMNDILQAEASWWSQRMGLVGGGTAGGVDTGGTPGVPPPSGGGDTGTGGNKPSRFWLEQQVISIANPSSSDAAFVWYQWMKGRSDAELAAWIEGHSDIDVPGYALGTLSARGGLAIVGEMGPELVALPGGSQVFDSVTTQRMMSGISVENISISVLEAKRPGDTAREVRREMTRIFEELAR